MQLASQSLAVRLHALEARNPQDILAAFAHMASLKADAVVVMPDPWLLSQRTRIVELAMRGRIPAMYHLRQYLEVGGLMAYGPTYIESFQQGAVWWTRSCEEPAPGICPSSSRGATKSASI